MHRAEKAVAVFEGIYRISCKFLKHAQRVKEGKDDQKDPEAPSGASSSSGFKKLPHHKRPWEDVEGSENWSSDEESN